MGIGLYASLRVRNSIDYVLAGRSLPLYVTIATVFATWFGSEAVLGIPATFMEEGLGGIVADPFGAGLCLIFVGMFFAAKLYRMKLVTIGDYYRQRYGYFVEMVVSVAICLSYLGWVAAQVVALGIIINIVSGGVIGFEWGMAIGLATVMFYTILGGMWSVAISDFVQMVVILIGLMIVAYMVATQLDGGVMQVIDHAAAHDKFDFWPDLNTVSILAFLGALVTLALGSIPQQDVFQRVMSASDEKSAAYGTMIGGIAYIAFCFIPIFIVYGAGMLDPTLSEKYLQPDGDYQRMLPDFILQDMPVFVQVMFFGALLSAIMSTASATLLAPSVVFAENILKLRSKMDDKALLRTVRLCVFCFGLLVYGYAYLSSVAGLSIFEMVENAYLLPLCGAFVPLAFGVYWSRANNVGAISSIILGVGTWAILEIISYRMEDGMAVPPQLFGLFMAIIGMVGGSLLSAKKQIVKS